MNGWEFFWMFVGAIVLNVAFIAVVIWVVVTVLRAMGVIA